MNGFGKLTIAGVVIAVAGSASSGVNITNLPTSSACVNSTDTAGQSVPINATLSADNSVLPASGAFTSSTNATDTGTVNNGLTFDITFIPTAADLSTAANTSSGANVRLLAEIGGSGSGSGAFLVNGVPTFVSKVAGAAGDNPTNGTDTALGTAPQTITNQYAGGVSLQPGVQYTLVAGLGLTTKSSGAGTGGTNPLTTITGQFLYLDTNNDGSAVTGTLNAVVDSRTNDGNTTNYNGNNTVSVRTKSTAVGAGGTTGTAAIAQIGGSDTTFNDTFYSGLSGQSTDGIQSFTGTISDGLLFNAVSTIVPEPTTFVLASIGGFGFLSRRRSSVGQ